MKRLRLIALFFYTTLTACTEDKQKETRDIKEIDSLLNIQKVKHIPDKEVFNDTLGVSNSPVKVISSKLYKEEYASTRSISITVKNVSDKNIEGIRFHWMTNGTWGTEDMGRYTSLKTDELIKKGHTRTYTWDIKSQNKKIYLVWPHEVVFSDGSRWQLKAQ
jgi:hypothetical protein